MVGGRDPQILDRGVVGSHRGVVVGVVDGLWNVIIISYHVRKWWLLKRNRIICPEVAISEHFLPGKSIFVLKLPEKIEIFQNFASENRICLICLEKSKFLENLHGKFEIFRKFAWKHGKFFENLPGKIEIFLKFACKNQNFLVKLLEKIEISLKFAWRNRHFFYLDPRPPRFQTRLTPLLWVDDSRLLQDSNLATRQPRRMPHHIIHLILQTLLPSEWRTSQPYVYAKFASLEMFPTTLRPTPSPSLKFE